MRTPTDRATIWLGAVLAALVGGCAAGGRPVMVGGGRGAPGGALTAAARRAAWAAPVDRPGLPNLYRVTPGLYRSALPTGEGLRHVRAMGIKTVINMCTTTSDREEAAAAGLAYERIYFHTWHPEDEDVARFLRIAADPARTPVLVHCRFGADRTGMMCAVYRVIVCGWTKEEALREMTEGPFGFDPGCQNLVDYVLALNVKEMNRRAGLAP